MVEKATHLRPQHRYSTTGDYEDAAIDQVSIGNILDRGMLPFFPYTIETAIRKNRFSFSEDFCRYHLFSFVLEGKLRYTFQNRKYTLSSGMVLIIPAGSSYSFDTFTTGHYKKLVIEFAGPQLNMICSTLGLDHFTLQPVGDTQPLLDIIEKIRGLMETSRKNLPELMGLSMQFLMQLSQALGTRNKPMSLFHYAKQRLTEDFTTPLSITDLADELGMSYTNLHRIFRQELNISPLQYRNSLKIELARELLQHSDLSIKEIAARVGYCNQFHFSRDFRTHTGKTPSEFRADSLN